MTLLPKVRVEGAGKSPVWTGRGKLTPLWRPYPEDTLRETILRTLASRAATDPEFLRQARQDLTGTLTRNGYQLTEGELRSVEEL